MLHIWLAGGCKKTHNFFLPNLRFSHCVFQENISKAPCVQRYDHSTGSHGCSMVRFYINPSFILNTFANPFLRMTIYYLHIKTASTGYVCICGPLLTASVKKKFVLIKFMLCFLMIGISWDWMISQFSVLFRTSQRANFPKKSWFVVVFFARYGTF